MYTIKLSRRNNQMKVKHVTHALRLRHSGARGPQGRPGKKGDTGAGTPAGGLTNQVLQKASDADYDYKWLNPTYSDKTLSKDFHYADEVVVNHGLGKFPAVSIIDSAGDEVEGNVRHVDTSSLIVTFDRPFSGTVTCN